MRKELAPSRMNKLNKHGDSGELVRHPWAAMTLKYTAMMKWPLLQGAASHLIGSLRVDSNCASEGRRAASIKRTASNLLILGPLTRPSRRLPPPWRSHVWCRRDQQTNRRVSRLTLRGATGSVTDSGHVNSWDI